MAKHAIHRIERFVRIHWRAGILFGLSAYLGVHYGRGLHSASYLTLLWMALAACWLSGLATCFGYRKRLHRLTVREQLTELCHLRWCVFEERVAQAFRFRGYEVESAGRAEAQAGLDLILRKQGVTTLVQCRRWQHRNVEVKDVRELYNLMPYHHACAAKIVACGDYTEDAWKFVAGKPFELIYGETLLAMLNDARQPVGPCAAPRRPPSLRPMNGLPKTG